VWQHEEKSFSPAVLSVKDPREISNNIAPGKLGGKDHSSMFLLTGSVQRCRDTPQVR
jgi:hypothetical protein